MGSDNNFLIRQAKQIDLPCIYELMAEFDMFGEFEADTCLIAKNEDALMGFIRLERVECQTYIRPIVVAKEYQGLGVGRALLQRVVSVHSNLMAIARGDKTGFYTQFGFSLIPWDVVYLPFQNECMACPDLGACNPAPLILVVG